MTALVKPAAYNLPDHAARIERNSPAFTAALAELNALRPDGPPLLRPDFHAAVGTALKKVLADQQAAEVAAFEAALRA